MKAKEKLDGLDNTEGNNTIEKISSLLPPNPIVTVDVGQHECWCAQSLHLKGHNGRILIGGGYGSMGCGLPYAIGAAISSGKCFCITGDGGLQMNIQELEVVVRENLPIKILVINNMALGKISEIQHGSYNDRYAQTTTESGYSVPDFEKVAKAYGLQAVTLGSYHELDNYADWFTNDSPCLINIMLPFDTLLIPKIKWETGKIKPELDDETLSQVKKILE
jgi:acetolactate synthase-1/2/3 large subunit